MSGIAFLYVTFSMTPDSGHPDAVQLDHEEALALQTFLLKIDPEHLIPFADNRRQAHLMYEAKERLLDAMELGIRCEELG